ncbi:hypothetical protein RCL1_006458 [Eukaryota sp. TZLM3-RCL]
MTQQVIISDFVTAFVQKLEHSDRFRRLSALKVLCKESIQDLDQIISAGVFFRLHSLLGLNDSEVVASTFDAIICILQQTRGSLITPSVKDFCTSGCFSKCLYSLYNQLDTATSIPSNTFIQSLSVFEALFALPITPLGIPQAFIKAGGLKVLINIIRRPRIVVDFRIRAIALISKDETLFNYIVKDVRIIRMILGHLGSHNSEEQSIALTFLDSKSQLITLPKSFIKRAEKVGIISLLTTAFATSKNFDVSVAAGINLFYFLSAIAQRSAIFSNPSKRSLLLSGDFDTFAPITSEELAAVSPSKIEALYCDIIDHCCHVLSQSDYHPQTNKFSTFDCSRHQAALMILYTLSNHSEGTSDLIFNGFGSLWISVLSSPISFVRKWACLVLLELVKIKKILENTSTLLPLLLSYNQSESRLIDVILTSSIKSDDAIVVPLERGIQLGSPPTIVKAIKLIEFVLCNHVNSAFRAGVHYKICSLIQKYTSLNDLDLINSLKDLLLLVCMEDTGRFLFKEFITDFNSDAKYQVLFRLASAPFELISREFLPLVNFSSTRNIPLNTLKLILFLVQQSQVVDLMLPNQVFQNFLVGVVDDLLRQNSQSSRKSEDLMVVFMIFLELSRHDLDLIIRLSDRFLAVFDIFSSQNYSFSTPFQLWSIVVSMMTLTNFFSKTISSNVTLPPGFLIKLVSYCSSFAEFSFKQSVWTFSSRSLRSAASYRSSPIPNDGSDEESAKIKIRNQRPPSEPIDTSSEAGQSNTVDVLISHYATCQLMSVLAQKPESASLSRHFSVILVALGSHRQSFNEIFVLPVTLRPIRIDWEQTIYVAVSSLSFLPPKSLLPNVLEYLSETSNDDILAIRLLSALLLKWSRQGSNQRKLMIESKILDWIESTLNHLTTVCDSDYVAVSEIHSTLNSLVHILKPPKIETFDRPKSPIRNQPKSRLSGVQSSGSNQPSEQSDFKLTVRDLSRNMDEDFDSEDEFDLELPNPEDLVFNTFNLFAGSDDSPRSSVNLNILPLNFTSTAELGLSSLKLSRKSQGNVIVDDLYNNLK